MNTYSNLTSANASKSGSLAKLSSGLRINKAGDDAAGLAISEKMKNQISGMTQASRNAQDGISLIQTAEGALSETHSILNRMRDLTVQASNGTNTGEDRTAIQKELNSLTDEISRIAGDTEFNTKGLLNGTTGAAPAQAAVPAETTVGSAATTEVSSNADHTALVAAYEAQTGETVDTTAIDTSAKLATEMENLSKADYEGIVTKYNTAATTNNSDADNTNDITALNATTISDAITETPAVEASPATAGSTSFSFQIGANSGETIDLSIKNMTAGGLGLTAEAIKVDHTDAEIAEAAANVDETQRDLFKDNLDTLDAAIKSVSEERANLGATQNRLDHTVSNLATTKENLSEANSRIRDVDMAEEMMSFTKSNILSQASTSMLAQANQMPQSVLSLLQ